MFHAYIIPIATCFIYTLYSFYAFYGTKLLTRCHSVDSLFSAVFGFRKALTEISAKLETSQPVFIFGIFATRKTKDETKKDREGPTSPGGAGPILAVPGGEEAPSAGHRPRSFAHINPPDLKNPDG